MEQPTGKIDKLQEQTHRCNLPCWCFIYWHLMNLLVSFSIYTPWSPLPSRLLQKATRLPCGKKLTPAGNQAWNASKMGISNSISSLDSQKKPPMTSMVSSMPKKPWLWKRPKACLGKTGAVPGARAAKVLGKTWQLGWFRGKFCWKTLFLHGFTMGFYLSKWLNMWVSWKKNAQKSLCPKERKWNRWHSIAMLDYRRVGYIEWRCPASYGFPPWENLSYQYH